MLEANVNLTSCLEHEKLLAQGKTGAPSLILWELNFSGTQLS